MNKDYFDLTKRVTRLKVYIITMESNLVADNYISRLDKRLELINKNKMQ
jgi:hypothetical protein